MELAKRTIDETKPTIVIVSYNRVFVEIVSALVETLKSRGFKVIVIPYLLKENENERYIYFDLAHMIGKLPKKYIVYQYEQTKTSSWFTGRYMEQLRNAEMVWDYSKSNIEWLKEQNIKNLVYVPFGYSPCLDYYRCDDEQPIDILFYGSLNDRRKDILTRLKKKGLRVSVHENNLFGLERDKLICKSKIILNLHYYTPGILQVSRLVPLISNEIFVVSEPCQRNFETNQEYTDYVIFSDFDTIVETCCHWVKNGLERRSFVQKAYQKFMTSNSMEKSFPWKAVFGNTISDIN